MSALRKKYPETGSETLLSFINDNLFEEQKQNAITSRLNFAFETNFSSDDPMKTAREFKQAGYDVHLVFLGLNSLEESILRVAYRVQRGGHKVSEESIRYNYEFGYKNLYKYVKEFDSVTLFDNGITMGIEPVIPREIMYIVNGKVHLKAKDYPAGVQPIVDMFQE